MATPPAGSSPLQAVSTSAQSVMVVAGTRPEVLKLVPVVRALEGLIPRVTVSFVTTGQHADLLRSTAVGLGVKPSHELHVLSAGQSLANLTSRVIDEVGHLLAVTRPRAVIVQGDTASAFGAAFAAFLARIPVFHVEAGLRTGQLHQPFPEEGFRRMITAIASMHFAPTPRALRALLSEGVARERVLVTGNTVVDLLLGADTPDATLAPDVEAMLSGVPRVMLLTVHRRENHGAPFASIAAQIVELLRTHPDLGFIVVRHPNPGLSGTLEMLTESSAQFPGRLLVVEPLPYEQVLTILSRCWLIATDSGGLQEEAPSFERPVLVLREATERLESIEAGVARLAGSDLRSGIEPALRGEFCWKPGTANPYGDGKAAARIAQAIARELGLSGAGGPALSEFAPVNQAID